MRARATVSIALVGLALLLGGCGGDSGGGGGGGAATADSGSGGETSPAPIETAGPTDGGEGAALDVCALVPAADVAAIVGGPADAGVDSSSVDLRVCSWQRSDDALEVLTVSIYVHPDAATASEQYLATTEGLGGVDILNLADEASYSDAFGLRVLAGRYDIGIESTGDDEKAASLALAQQILPQLP